VARDTAAGALAPLTLDDAAALGVLEADGSEARALATIAVHGDVLVTSDGVADADAPADHVGGMSLTTLTGLSLTHRAHVGRALDVGTGPGVQAVVAAAHSDEVVATDVNPRAVAYARFNALLNGHPEIDVREGRLFEPVEGERFGLVLCNAPYVVSPDSRYLFRDAGISGDGLSEAVVRGVTEHLDPGGTATLVVSWLGGDDEDWAARPRGWLDGAGCDAWVIGGQTLDPIAHAAKWNSILARDPEAHGAALDRWAAYLGELGATAVTEGVLVLRKRSAGEPWFRADRLPSAAPQSADGQIARIFAARDFLEGLPDDEALLDAPLVLAPTARIDQTFLVRDGKREVERIHLRLEEGVEFEADVDPRLADTLLRLDGRTPVREKLGEDVPEARAAGVLREMLETGFLDVPED
jgi:methylase of polypeptide subunit release factors